MRFPPTGHDLSIAPTVGAAQLERELVKLSARNAGDACRETGRLSRRQFLQQHAHGDFRGRILRHAFYCARDDQDELPALAGVINVLTGVVDFDIRQFSAGLAGIATLEALPVGATPGNA